MPPARPSEPLALWERASLILGGMVFIAFIALVEKRSCFSDNRMTDVGVYLRAGWAVRSGANLYAITDNNGWHYVYPPAFAVLMSPLADAPPGLPRDSSMPYPLSVLVWTFISILLVGRMAHVLAGLVMPNEPPGSRRWWYARTVPVCVALGGLGDTISRGQVNVFIVWLLVEMLRANAHGRRFSGGLWLSAAITIKFIPAYLLLLPLAKRDGRTLAGAAVGLVVGLGVVPLVGLGPERTRDAYASFINRVLMPGALGTTADNLLKDELLEVKATDNQSFLSVIHNNLHPDRLTQPPNASEGTRLAHVACVGLLTGFVLALAWKRPPACIKDEIILLGVLLAIMIHATPVSHMHYYAMGYPLAAGLWLKGMTTGRRAKGILTAWAVLTALPLLPGPFFEILRHRGLGLAASLALFAAAFRELSRTQAESLPMEQRLRRAA